MIKKTLSIILAFFMLLIPLTVISFAENTVTLKIPDEKVYAGEDFTLNLFISDNSKMSGAVIDISYDKTKLRFVSAENGGILNENANISIRNIDGDKPYVRFTYLDPSSEITSSGVIAKLKFKALDNAAGKTELLISVPNAGDFVTKDLDRIPYEAKNGVVEIINMNVSDTETETVSVTETETVSETESTTEPVTEQTPEKPDEGNNIWLVAFAVAISLAVIGTAVFAVVKSKRRD